MNCSKPFIFFSLSLMIQLFLLATCTLFTHFFAIIFSLSILQSFFNLLQLNMNTFLLLFSIEQKYQTSYNRLKLTCQKQGPQAGFSP